VEDIPCSVELEDCETLIRSDGEPNPVAGSDRDRLELVGRIRSKIDATLPLKITRYCIGGEKYIGLLWGSTDVDSHIRRSIRPRRQ
jgi:hypothetical protein